MTAATTEVQLGTALLAFTVAFYALVGREHKTPYITARAISTVYWVLLSLFLLTYAHLASEASCETIAILGELATLAARVILGVAFAYLVVSVFKVANRRTHFRDDILKNLSLVRSAKALKRHLTSPGKYHYNAVKISGPLLADLAKSEHLPAKEFEAAVENSAYAAISAAFRAETIAQADDLMVDLAGRFLANKGWVQYATCARHPSEFLHRLKTYWTSAHPATPWEEIRRRVIAIDAYSPHFGFTDTVHPVRLQQIKNDCLGLIRSGPTYAGLHTAASQAFNKIKEERESQGQDYRNPALIIYEAPHALVDLESTEQYRIFVRHVVPSERMWGGMFTLFVEPAISDDSWKLLRSYADFTIDPGGKSGGAHV